MSGVEITLRTAKPADAVAVMQAIRPMHEESAIQFPPIVEADALRWIIDVIERGFVVLAEVDGRIVGTLGLRVQTYPWNARVPFLYNTWFYVAPEFRKGGTAAKLLDKAKAAHHQHHGIGVLVDITTAVDAARKDRFMAAMGFTYMGGLFAYGLDKPAAAGAEAGNV